MPFTLYYYIYKRVLRSRVRRVPIERFFSQFQKKHLSRVKIKNFRHRQVRLAWWNLFEFWTRFIYVLSAKNLPVNITWDTVDPMKLIFSHKNIVSVFRWLLVKLVYPLGINYFSVKSTLFLASIIESNGQCESKSLS